jgi:hypothetical protein
VLYNSHAATPAMTCDWLPFVAAYLEEQLRMRGVAPQTAGMRARVLARALLHMARWVAAGEAGEEEIDEFLDGVCDMAFAQGVAS